MLRYTAWKTNRFTLLPAGLEVAMQPV